MLKKWVWLGFGGALCALGLTAPGCGGDDDNATGGTGGGVHDGGVDSGTGGFGADAGGTQTGLGAACDDDLDCGPDLSCLAATSNDFDLGEGVTGGPPKGMCSTRCESDPAVCQAFSDTATCLYVNDTDAYCFEGCEFGSTGQGFDPEKCHGRPEFSCRPLQVSETEFVAACLPRCNSDADCPSGRFCDPLLGLCSSVEPTGGDIGVACMETADCQGVCLNIVDDNDEPISQTCSERCTLGAFPACGWDGTGEATAVCLFPDSNISRLGGSPGIGDDGFCTALCDCNDDCQGGSECVQFEIAGRAGYCGVPIEGDQVIPCEPDPGSGGSAGAGGAGGTGGGAAGSGGAGGSGGVAGAGGGN